jgi:hypothetical protein
MTPDLLARIGTALWGFGWPHQLAKTLNVEELSVKQWAVDVAPIPASIAPELVRELKRHAGLCYSLISEIDNQEKTPAPRDEAGAMRRYSLFAVAAAVTVLCGGCSTIIEGTSQEIYVNTNPAAASCKLMREGRQIATINPTPGAAFVQKTKYDITIVCDRDGFEQATYLNHSGAAGATFGNIVLGGGIGWAIDSASGSDNKYDSPVNLTMVPKAAIVPLPAPQPSRPIGPTPRR